MNYRMSEPNVDKARGPESQIFLRMSLWKSPDVILAPLLLHSLTEERGGASTRQKGGSKQGKVESLLQWRRR